MSESARYLRDGLRHAVAVLGVTALLAGALVGGGRAAAWVPVPESGLPGMLSLRTLPGTPQWADVVPGQVAHWRIAADVDVPVPSSLTLELTSEGALATEAGLRVRVTGCEIEHVADGNGWRCDAGHETVLEEVTLAVVASDEPTTSWDLAPLAVGASRHLHVMLTVPEDAQVAGRSARVGIGVTAGGDTPAPGDSPGTPRLAATGLDWLMVALLGTGVLLLGVALRGTAHPRSTS